MKTTVTVQELFGIFRAIQSRSAQNHQTAQWNFSITMDMLNISEPLHKCDATIALTPEQAAIFRKYRNRND